MLLDLNNNGIDDRKEPAVWVAVGRFVSGLVLLFAPKHTIANKTAQVYRDAIGGGK